MTIYVRAGSSQSESGGQHIRVAQVKRHPSYGSPERFDNDICILKVFKYNFGCVFTTKVVAHLSNSRKAWSSVIDNYHASDVATLSKFLFVRYQKLLVECVHLFSACISATNGNWCCPCPVSFSWKFATCWISGSRGWLGIH